VLQLQNLAGNQAVLKLLGVQPGVESVQRAPSGLVGGLAVGLATSLLSYLRGADLDEAAVRGLVAMGIESENDLTNLLFWAQHPEAALRKIEPGDNALAADWLQIRDTIVRPALGPGSSDRGTPEPELPEPAGPKPVKPKPVKPKPGGVEPSSGGIGAEELGWYRDAAATRFRQQVYAEQLERKLRQKKEFFPGLPTDHLDKVEGDHELHIDAVEDARNLLAAARADLAVQKDAGKADALKVAWIGIGSAYRNPKRDFAAWQSAFNTHYNDTASKRAGLAGGAHGHAAVSLLVNRMVVKKAVPGFSNHTKGLAIDFSTRQGEWTFVSSSAQTAGWKRTWLFGWLTNNAGNHKFKPYSKEPWHWDHSS
jgi:hypothetical protein